MTSNAISNKAEFLLSHGFDECLKLALLISGYRRSNNPSRSGFSAIRKLIMILRSRDRTYINSAKPKINGFRQNRSVEESEKF